MRNSSSIICLLATAIVNVHGVRTLAAMDDMRPEVEGREHLIPEHTSWTSPSGFFIQV